MPLEEVLTNVQALSRLDKIRLIQWIARDLETSEQHGIEPGKEYAVWSPFDAYPAAAAIMQALRENLYESSHESR